MERPRGRFDAGDGKTCAFPGFECYFAGNNMNNKNRLLKEDYFYKKIKSPLCDLILVASDKGLKLALFDPGNDEWKGAYPGVRRSYFHSILNKAERQLNEYFCRKRTEFDLPVDFEGTDFQIKVWMSLLKIPYGHTICYSEQARMIGDVRKARAVGMANGKNPISIIVPCHRVIGKNGSLTGFTGGLEKKAFLLAFEQKTLLSS